MKNLNNKSDAITNLIPTDIYYPCGSNLVTTTYKPKPGEKRVFTINVGEPLNDVEVKEFLNKIAESFKIRV
jgi:hypothetical protein